MRLLDSNDGLTALHTAALFGQLGMVKSLVEEQGLDVNAKNHNGQTALHWAAAGGSLEVVRYLVSQRADVNAMAAVVATALHAAAIFGHLGVVKYLVEEQGADVNAKSILWALTARDLAVKNGHTKIVEYLDSHGRN